MITIIIGGVILWTIGGFIWFLNNMGNKNGPEPWYAIILLIPVIVIGVPCVFIGFMLEKYDDWKYRKN